MRVWLLASLVLLAACQRPEQRVSPSFDCQQAKGEVQQRICNEPSLAELDRDMDRVYKSALAVAGESAPTLRATQRGVIKGRDECWKSDDVSGCAAQVYRLRIAELQARYRLVPGEGPLFFQCGASPANEVVITRFATEPATLIAERGDQVSLMYLQSGDRVHYFGRNESVVWNGQSVQLVWGAGAGPLTCQQRDAEDVGR